MKKKYTPPVYIGQNLYIKPSYVVSMPEIYYEGGGSRVVADRSKENLKDNAHNGVLSKKSQNEIKNAINWLCLAAKRKRVFVKKSNTSFFFKVSFITLTLPDTDVPITGNDFTKKLLNPFLVYLRKYHQLKNYVWKLEYQENGKIHAHITNDTFIHWRDLRKCWNRLLKRNGYLSLFERSFGHSDPNSTDVHSTKTIRNLAAYLAKYMAKSDQLASGHVGRIWGCNYELSRAKACKVHIPASEVIEEMRSISDAGVPVKDLMRHNPVTNELTKVGEIFYPTAADWLKKIRGIIYDTFEETRRSITSVARHFTTYELAL